MAHSHDHSHDHSHSHSHDAVQSHGHSHDLPDGPGTFPTRALPNFPTRDFGSRSFTVGIGGPVGSGKTALVLGLCEMLRSTVSMGVVTNDIFTREDCEFLVGKNALDKGRIRAVVTGGCPHAAVREDISGNVAALEALHRDLTGGVRVDDDGDSDDSDDDDDEKKTANQTGGVAEGPSGLIDDSVDRLGPDLLLIESGGDNLAANFSRELADYIIYVVDVAGGDKVPRKGGPGTTQSDLLVINKTSIAAAVGADLGVMERDAKKMRDMGPTVLADVKSGKGLDQIASLIVADWLASGAVQAKRWARRYGSLSNALAGVRIDE